MEAIAAIVTKKTPSLFARVILCGVAAVLGLSASAGVACGSLIDPSAWQDQWQLSSLPPETALVDDEWESDWSPELQSWNQASWTALPLEPIPWQYVWWEPLAIEVPAETQRLEGHEVARTFLQPRGRETEVEKVYDEIIFVDPAVIAEREERQRRFIRIAKISGSVALVWLVIGWARKRRH